MASRSRAPARCCWWPWARSSPGAGSGARRASRCGTWSGRRCGSPGGGRRPPAWWRCRWQGRDWLVRGVLPDAFWQRPRWWPLLPARRRAYLAVLAGEEGSGKSYLLTYLAVCLVLGLDWLGVPVRRLRAVVYAELGAGRPDVLAAGGGDRRRAGAGRPRGGPARLPPADRLPVPGATTGRTWPCPPPTLPGGASGPAGLERIRRTVRGMGAGLVLLDGLTTGGGMAPGDQEGATRQQNHAATPGLRRAGHRPHQRRRAPGRLPQQVAAWRGCIYTLRRPGGGVAGRGC